VTLVAVIIYIIGAGIEKHAMWARVFGMLISIGFSLISLGALTLMPRRLASHAMSSHRHIAVYALGIGLEILLI